MTESNSSLQLRAFISNNNLNTQTGIILFNASVSLYRKDNPITVFSEIQVITLPKEMALYILEFVKDSYHNSEIYSTRLYSFNCTGKNTLEIRDEHSKDLPLLSITAVE